MKKNRIIALLLAIVLCIGMLPLSAFAEEPEAPTESVASEQSEDDPITLPAEEPEDASQPEEEISAALENTPDSIEPSAEPEPSPTPDPEDDEDHERTPAGPSEDDPIMAYDGAEMVREKAVTVTPKKGMLKAAAQVGETGTLRVLFYVFKSDVGNTASFGHLERLPAKAVLTGGVYKAAYCLDSELLASNGVSYTWDTMEWSNKRLVGDVLALGFQYLGSSGWTAESAENYKWAVCQLLIWAVQNGKITRNTDGIPYFSAQVDADMQTAANHSYNPSDMMAYYNSLKADLIKLRKIPSFAGRTASTASPIKLNWNGTNYSATVTDANGVLDRYNFEIDGATLTKNGNSLTISMSGDSAGEKTSPAATYAPHIGEGAVAVWKSAYADYQTVAVYDGGGEVDPIPAYIKVSFDAVGSAGLKKTSEDGIVSGISFTITGSDGSSVTKTTDSSGSISLDGLPIYQTGEDGEDGERITYTATEQTPIRYVTPRSQTFQLFEGQETSLSFENRLKKWNVTVTKSDRETTAAQGDASLGGAVYGVYHNGVLQDQYTTNASGKFTSDWYPCGSGWTLKEISPSTGYLLNETTVSVGLEPGSTSIEYNATSKSVMEQVKKGKISIVKHTDNGDTQIETPETGAEFQIYLTAAGSYSSAKSTERDVLTCNEAGFAESKLLPYGRYTVHQTKGWDGREKITDFQVFIAEDGKTYPFIINNRIFEAYIQVVKLDATTGRVIPASGVGFMIKDLTSGKFITQHINYPTPQDIVVYYTDVTGKLMLPDTLGYGTYQLIETNSAYGYTLASQPVEFKVDGTSKTVTVTMTNTPQMGRLTLEKSGEVFSSVVKSNGKYQPVYEVQGLSGAVYGLYAAEDIVTLDGTTRHALGELVEQVETNAEGKATFPAVYLGKYKVVELQAPEGYVKDNTEHLVELEYAGQTVALVTEHLACTDARQKVKIDLTKTLEQDETYGLGMNSEREAVRFGLYAAEKLTARDGREIPADGLLEEIGMEEKDKATFVSDLPFGRYYVREIATDEHYLLNSTRYPVELSYAGQQMATVRLHANDGLAMENTLKRGSVTGRKAGEDGNVLAGVLFGLFPADAEEFTAEAAFLSVRSGEDGSFTFDRVPVGSYQIKELETLPGYVLLAEPIPVEITEDGQVVELGDLVNEHTKVLISKQSTTGTDELPGATLKVFTAEGELIEEWVSTDEPHLVERLPVGDYVLHEVTAPDGYLVAEDVDFTVEETGEIQPVVMKDRPRPPVTFPRYGALKIVKTSEDGVLEGFSFRITGPGYDKSFTTDKYGEISLEDLTPGEYTVTEVEGEARYVLPESQILMVEVDQTAKAEFYNRLARGSLQGRKNGEDGKPLAGAVFGLFRVDAAEFTEEAAIATVTTGEDGSFAMSDILLGKYQLVELETLPGYVLLLDPIPVEITEDGQVVELAAIVNEHTKVQISKQDLTTGQELPGAKLELRDADGKVIEEWVSTDKPHLIERLPAGKYTLREITAPEGYDVAEEVVFEVKPTGQIQQVVMKDRPTPDIPDTGDHRPFVPIFLTMTLALGASAGVFLYQRGRRK